MSCESRTFWASLDCRIQLAPNNLVGIVDPRAPTYITLFTTSKRRGDMDGDSDKELSAWSMLGKSSGLNNNSAEVERLEKLIEDLRATLTVVQGELLGSLEALQRRIRNLEENKVASSALDVMSVEELNDLTGTEIGVWPDREDAEGEESEVTVVESGFTYNAPPEEEEEVDLDKWQLAAKKIVSHIDEVGGVANADWKRKSLTPEDFDVDDRKKVTKILSDEYGVSCWKKNRIWWFFYFGKEDESLDESYKRAYGTDR